MGCSFGVVPNYPNYPNYRRKQLQTIFHDSNETSVSVSCWCHGLASRQTQTLLEKVPVLLYFSESRSAIFQAQGPWQFFFLMVNPS